MPVKRDVPVVKVGEWQSAQPTELNTLQPFVADAVSGAGTAGAESRMKLAKSTTSEDISAALPVEFPLSLTNLAAARII